MPLKTNTRFDALKSSSSERGRGRGNRFTNNRRRNYTPKYRNNKRSNSKTSYIPPHMRNKRSSALKIKKKPTFSLSNEQFPELGNKDVVKQELPEEMKGISYKEKIQVEVPEEKKSDNVEMVGMTVLNKDTYFQMLDEIEENKKYFHYTDLQWRNLNKLFSRKTREWEELEEMEENVKPFNYKEFYDISDDIPSEDESEDEDDNDDSDEYDDYYYY